MSTARDQAAGILGPGKLRQLEEAGLVVVEAGNEPANRPAKHPGESVGELAADEGDVRQPLRPQMRVVGDEVAEALLQLEGSLVRRLALDRFSLLQYAGALERRLGLRGEDELDQRRCLIP